MIEKPPVARGFFRLKSEIGSPGIRKKVQIKLKTADP
jgi:hypothetical protein